MMAAWWPSGGGGAGPVASGSTGGASGVTTYCSAAFTQPRPYQVMPLYNVKQPFGEPKALLIKYLGLYHPVDWLIELCMVDGAALFLSCKLHSFVFVGSVSFVFSPAKCHTSLFHLRPSALRNRSEPRQGGIWVGALWPYTPPALQTCTLESCSLVASSKILI